MQKLLISLLLLFYSGISVSDEIRPAYLQLTENTHNVFSVIWKVPVKANKKLSLQPVLPSNCTQQTPAQAQLINAAYIQRWLTYCESGLTEKNILISGLEKTSTEVLLHIELLNSTSLSARLLPTQTSYLVPVSESSLQIINTYSWLGIEHILLGIDHLLFVFALLLIVGNKRRLLWTITAFTIAHSLTLAGATLGFVYVPQQPVEAVIALSILFLAMEIVHDKNGNPGIAAKWPWLVAFIFGLLHGFGFAGALAEVGLPQQAIPLALVFFNVGVELGQLLFVAIVVLLGWLLQKLKQPKILDWGETVAVYSIGSFSSFWLFERISVF